jgi:hypothetical protein
LPHPARARFGHRLRLERALGLRQVNQILRHAFFLQHPPDHVAVAPLAAKPGFDDGAAARRLEKIQIGENLIVDRQRNVMRDGAHFAFGAAPQIGIEFFRLRDWLFGDFINRRGRGLLFAETVAGAEGLEFIEAHRVDNVVVQGAQTRVGVEVESARQQLVERFIELLARFSKVAGLKILFARVERRLAACGKLLRPVRRRLND